MSTPLRDMRSTLRIAWAESRAFAAVRSPTRELLLAPVLLLPSIVFVLRLFGLDTRIGNRGVADAMRWILRRYYGPVRICGNRPTSAGALLVVGNHPGLGDLPALVTALGRDDVMVLVKERELFRTMPRIRSASIEIGSSLASRAAAISAMLAQLAGGHVVIVYPAGAIEPDPARRHDVRVADEDHLLRPWFPIVDGVARRLQRSGIACEIVPVLTEGVHHVPRALAAVVDAAPDDASRSGRAALVTMLSLRARRARISVTFGAPASATSFAIGRFDTPVTNQVRSELLRMANRGAERSSECVSWAHETSSQILDWVAPATRRPFAAQRTGR